MNQITVKLWPCYFKLFEGRTFWLTGEGLKWDSLFAPMTRTSKPHAVSPGSNNSEKMPLLIHSPCSPKKSVCRMVEWRGFFPDCTSHYTVNMMWFIRESQCIWCCMCAAVWSAFRNHWYTQGFIIQIQTWTGAVLEGPGWVWIHLMIENP